MIPLFSFPWNDKIEVPERAPAGMHNIIHLRVWTYSSMGVADHGACGRVCDLEVRLCKAMSVPACVIRYGKVQAKGMLLKGDLQGARACSGCGLIGLHLARMHDASKWGALSQWGCFSSRG